MPRGAPDYSNVRSGEVLERLDDLAEIVPRLGFPSSIDRAGRVVMLETFKHGGGACVAQSAGLGETTQVSGEYSRYGGYTYELETVASVNSYAGVYTRVAAVGRDRVGAEAQFIVQGNYPVLKLILAWHDGEYSYNWTLRWDTTTDKVHIKDSDGTYLDVSGDYELFLHASLTHTMKLVADIDDESYVRAYIDGALLTLPEATAVKAAYALTPDLAVTFRNGVGPAHASRVYVDTLILTRDEL